MQLIKEITWDNDHISLNEWYSGKHWSNRAKQKNKWKLKYLSLFGCETPRLSQFKIELTYNSRLDNDNCITLIKLFSDFLKERMIVKDDSKKYWRGLSITPDESLPKNTYVLRLYGVLES